jgi:tRNA dimethylallyltransferase
VSVSSDLEALLPDGVHGLIGPTASGKSALALAVAERCGAELVSLDSMQVYRGMDVGTAKPTPAERARVRHHMLDLVEPSAVYDVSRYLADLRPVLEDCARRGARVLFVGGTGFYLKVLLDGLFEGPRSIASCAHASRRAGARGQRGAARGAGARRCAQRGAPARPRREAHRARARGLRADRQAALRVAARVELVRGPARSRALHRLVALELAGDELDRRILERARAMLDAGWEDEARAIVARGGFSRSSIQALGYAQVLELLPAPARARSALRRIALATRQFARRQRTWYRKFPSALLPAPGNEGADEARDAAPASARSDGATRRSSLLAAPGPALGLGQAQTVVHEAGRSDTPTGRTKVPTPSTNSSLPPSSKVPMIESSGSGTNSPPAA